MLETLEPNPAWDGAAHEETVETLAAHDDLVYRVWGGDWCTDCRTQLPDLGAALDAAGIPDDQVRTYELDQQKDGPRVDEYDIEYIPTVVVERDGEECARFVEEAPVPVAVSLARQLRESDGS